MWVSKEQVPASLVPAAQDRVWRRDPAARGRASQLAPTAQVPGWEQVHGMAAPRAALQFARVQARRTAQTQDHRHLIPSWVLVSGAGLLALPGDCNAGLVPSAGMGTTALQPAQRPFLPARWAGTAVALAAGLASEREDTLRRRRSRRRFGAGVSTKGVDAGICTTALQNGQRPFFPAVLSGVRTRLLHACARKLDRHALALFEFRYLAKPPVLIILESMGLPTVVLC